MNLVGLNYNAALNHPTDREEGGLPWMKPLNRPCHSPTSHSAMDALAFSGLFCGSAQMLTI
jgi:hypothetical protein